MNSRELTFEEYCIIVRLGSNLALGSDDNSYRLKYTDEIVKIFWNLKREKHISINIIKFRSWEVCLHRIHGMPKEKNISSSR